MKELVILGFIIGLVLGSLVKALADRSLTNKSFWGRSYCTNCQHKLHWYDLLPIISYISLLGRCRYCQKAIGREYIVVEVLMGVLVAALFYQAPNNFQFDFKTILFLFDLLFKSFFMTVLAIVALTDLKKTLIPDRIMFPSIYIGLVALIAVTLSKVIYLYYYLNQTPLGQSLLPPKSDYFTRHALIYAQDLLGSLSSAVIIAGFFLMLIIVTKGRGMGGGDVKLGFFIGLGLGFPNGILAVMLSFITGAMAAIMLIIGGKKHFGENIPFGPFLVVGSLIALFWGNDIINWYINLSR